MATSSDLDVEAVFLGTSTPNTPSPHVPLDVGGATLPVASSSAHTEVVVLDSKVASVDHELAKACRLSYDHNR